MKVKSETNELIHLNIHTHTHTNTCMYKEAVEQEDIRTLCVRTQSLSFDLLTGFILNANF